MTTRKDIAQNEITSPKVHLSHETPTGTFPFVNKGKIHVARMTGILIGL
jgi:hypothetical protein